MSDTPRATQVAVLQLCATPDVAGNLATVATLAREARSAGAEVITLPEAFAFIGPDREKQKILEPLPGGGPILEACRELAGELECQTGDRRLGHNARIGYFSQHRSAALNPR